MHGEKGLKSFAESRVSGFFASLKNDKDLRVIVEMNQNFPCGQEAV